MNEPDAPQNPPEPAQLPDSRGTAPHLELPDAPDFRARRSSIPLERMLEILEQYRHWFPLTEAERAEREKRRCTVEFVL
jgi:hypothetical protein